MVSATKILLNKTQQEIWHRGESYADKGLVSIISDTDKKVQAVVQGTKEYDVKLRLSTAKIIINCSCPYFTKNGYICKHIVATAIVWDEKRGITRPDQSLVEKVTIPPSALSRQNITTLFKNPLKADLDQLRILPEETALGGYVRRHSRLPNIPKIGLEEGQALTQQEIRKCYSEMKRWTQRKAYDPYFCSGEMVAAFCELLRIIKIRLAATTPLVAAEILLSAQKFNRTLVTELIDDSQGLHEFSEAYLKDIYHYLREFSITADEKDQFVQLLQQFEHSQYVY
ncbi:MAG: hypothetical protein DRP46_03770 [Candidatus Zixiibacteriota bacterium]|nr:MAG: hypothetical protein DRP46_03770 [candidate division Zixibacteria bacterium]